MRHASAGTSDQYSQWRSPAPSPTGRSPRLSGSSGRARARPIGGRAFPPPLGRLDEPLSVPPEFSGRDYAIFLPASRPRSSTR